MSVWQELRRRHVFRIGAAYAVVAWLLVQIASIVLPAFDFSPIVFRAFLVLTAIGFVVAVALAWLYELTPTGIRRDGDVSEEVRGRVSAGRKLDFAIIATLAVAVAFLLLRDRLTQPDDAGQSPVAESLAVLAFTNRSADPADAYFADGLADELLSTLSRVRELRVASRTSSFYFRDKDVDVPTIASILDVANILSGSVQRVGDSIRVTVALDDTESGQLLWSESFDRGVENLLDIQRDIARSVAAAIVPVLSPESASLIASRPTENAQAYDFYLRGRDYLRLPGEASTISSAMELFGRAIDLDPRFGEAYAGLCEARLLSFERVRTTAAFEDAETACHRALTLDAGAWEVRLALGNLYLASGLFDQARLEIEAGLATQPNAVDLILALARTYSLQAEYGVAEEMLLRAESMASGYWRVQNELGHLYLDSARHDEAVARYRRVIELTPDSGIGYDNLGNTLLAMARFVEAEAAFNDSPLPSRWTYENRGLVYYYLREFERSVEDHRQALELAPEYYVEWGRLGDAYRYLPGREADARVAYLRAIDLAESALAINPDSAETMGRLSTYLVHVGEQARARELAERFDALELRLRLATSGNYFAALTRLFLGDTEHAIDMLQQTIESGWVRATMLADPDLESLLGDDRFELL